MFRVLHRCLPLALVALSAIAAPAALADPPDVSITLAGTLQQTHEDTPDGSVPITFLSTASGPQSVTFAADQPVPPSGSEVELTGRLRDDTLAADATTVTGPSIPVPTTSPDGRDGGSAALTQDQGTPLAAGAVRKLAVVVITFSGANGAYTPTYSDAAIQNVLISNSNSVSNYFNEQSYGKVSFSLAPSDIHRVTIAADGTGCNDDGTAHHNPGWMTWGSQAATAASLARAQYGSYTNFDHVIYVFNSRGTCGWAGLGYMPGDEVYIDNAFTLPVVAHELGHNLGVHHASTLRCSAGGQIVAFSSTNNACSSNEYGDPYDVMGQSQSNHENAFHKLQSGWLDVSRSQTITASGSYTLSPLESSGGVALLLVPHVTAGSESNAAAGTPVGTMFALDFRQPTGTAFDAYSSSSPAVGGVQVRLVQAPGGSPIQTQLIDTNPQTSTFADAALTNGSTFVDVTDGITIKTTDVNPLGATVLVTLGPVTTSDAPVVVAPDTSAPSAVSGLTATPASGPVVSLAFGAASDDRAVSGYEITRDGVQIDAISAAQTTYADWSTSYGTHTYGVTAVDTTGNIGVTTNVLVVVVPPVIPKPTTTPGKKPTSAGPSKPGSELVTPIRITMKLKTVKHRRRALLSWVAVKGAHTYTVTRNGKKLRATRSASLIDTSPPRGALRYGVTVNS